MKNVLLSNLCSVSPFNELFPIDPDIRAAIKESLETDGYNAGYPVHVWAHNDSLIVLDGHTRLQAAAEANLDEIPVHELSFESERDALSYAISAQRDRRNMSRQEIQAHQVRIFELLDQRRDLGGDHKSEEYQKSKAPMGAFDLSKSADDTAEKTGMSTRQVERLRSVMESGNDELIDAVRTGETPIRHAYEAIKEKKNATAETKIAFNRTNDNIEWAKWSWNPVTGCEQGCEYCYARDIANRFYQHKFKPTLHPDRLSAPANTKPIPGPGGNNVFVCSMADLFGEWITNDWIFQTLDACANNKNWNYLFLTKNPARYKSFEFSENCWIGTTVDTQARVETAQSEMQAAASNGSSVRFLSCEPMLEELKFSDLSMFDWIIIGGRSKNSNGAESQPDWKWVWNLTEQAYKQGIKVYWKPNLTVRPKEYPC